MKKLNEKNAWMISAENTTHKKKSMMKITKIRTSCQKKKYHWHINFQNSEKAQMCFKLWCTNIKVIETCLEEYQTMIRKARTEFASEIQKFEKLIKKKLLDVIVYAISWTKNFQ